MHPLLTLEQFQHFAISSFGTAWRCQGQNALIHANVQTGQIRCNNAYIHTILILIADHRSSRYHHEVRTNIMLHRCTSPHWCVLWMCSTASSTNNQQSQHNHLAREKGSCNFFDRVEQHVKRLTIFDKHLRVFCCWEMANAFHRLMLATSDLVAGRLAHGRSVTPIVLAREHVDYAY